MKLSTSQIKGILENAEDLSPKCLAIIITDMAERIEYIERCYMDLDTKYSILKDEHNSLKKNYTKHHLNSMYGMMVDDKTISDALRRQTIYIKENTDND